MGHKRQLGKEESEAALATLTQVRCSLVTFGSQIGRTQPHASCRQRRCACLDLPPSMTRQRLTLCQDLLALCCAGTVEQTGRQLIAPYSSEEHTCAANFTQLLLRQHGGTHVCSAGNKVNRLS